MCDKDYLLNGIEVEQSVALYCVLFPYLARGGEHSSIIIIIILHHYFVVNCFFGRILRGCMRGTRYLGNSSYLNSY
jgi:hypothetical protein